MSNFISRWFGKRQEMQTRLSKEQAIAIARQAAADDTLARHLSMTTLETRSGKLVWTVGSASVGLMLEVCIDDATGEVLTVKRTGVR